MAKKSRKKSQKLRLPQTHVGKNFTHLSDFIKPHERILRERLCPDPKRHFIYLRFNLSEQRSKQIERNYK